MKYVLRIPGGKEVMLTRDELSVGYTNATVEPAWMVRPEGETGWTSVGLLLGIEGSPNESKGKKDNTKEAAPGQSAPVIVKNQCQHCGKTIQFDVTRLDPNNAVFPCPHCSLPTRLAAPQPNQAPVQVRQPQSSSSVLKYAALVCGVAIVVLLACIVVILLNRRDAPVIIANSNDTPGQVDLNAQQRVWQKAVAASIEEYQAAQKSFGDPSEDSPAEYLARLTKHLERLKAIDISRCPSDYREAFVRLFNAWDGLAYQVSREPQSAGQGFLQGVVNGLNGEVDGGVRRWVQARQARYDCLQAAQEEVNAVAARY